MERRSFLKLLTHGLGVTFAAVLGFPAIAYLIDPRHRKAPPSTFRTIARLSELPVGEPTQAVIRDARRDAYTVYPDELVGRVWLIRRDESSVDAFTTECPHLGCSVNLNNDKKGFTCPCHEGRFDLNGKCLSGPPPRGMDQLRVRIVADPDPGNLGQKIPDRLVQVEFKKFINNRAEKVERT